MAGEQPIDDFHPFEMPDLVLRARAIEPINARQQRITANSEQRADCSDRSRNKVGVRLRQRREIPRSPNDQDALITVRRGNVIKSNTDVALPRLHADYADTFIHGVRYRVRTVAIPGPDAVTPGAPARRTPG